MSDDAPQPQPSFYTSLSRSFARVTLFIDDHLRIVQYGIYCCAATGVLLVLHSARAFTKFTRIQDIPEEFIRKHVRLHGHVKWVGTTPPTTSSTSLAALPLNGAASSSSVSHAKLSPTENGSITSPFSTKDNMTRENLLVGAAQTKENQDGALRPWKDNNDSRILCDEDFLPLFLQVEHTPVIALWHKKSNQPLNLQLADVEVTGSGVMSAQAQLVGQRAWFTLLAHNTHNHTLLSLIKPAKVFERSVNEQLVRSGLALTGPMELKLYNDPFYVKHYKRLLRAQEYAERRQLGIWKQPRKHKGILANMWGWLRALSFRSKQ
nr:uncharacterized protein LOC128696549 [Cherax quadricarinatus]